MFADPSQEGPQRSTIDSRDCSLLLPDGIKLKARIWTPRHSQGPWPALVMRQPYGRTIASTVTYAHPSWWANQGFLVVVQDVRGQGDSGGQFGGFGQEAADTSATLEWVRQLPDCNGRIGLYGFSYQGFTQLLAEAHTAPPNCLAPAMTGLDERDHWSCEGGAHWWHLGLGWGLQLAALQAQRRDDAGAWDEIRRCLEQNRHYREGLDLLRRHDPDGMALRWLQQSPDDDVAWICHQPSEAWLRQPMLLIGGWWDPHLRGVLDLHRRSLEQDGTPELHIGPATHLEWWPEAQQLHLDFFRRHLIEARSSSALGEMQPATSPRLIQVWDQCLQRWSAVSNADPQGGAWRLTGSALTCHDPSDGQLVAASALNSALNAAHPAQPDPRIGHTPVVIVHDPWRAVPALGGHLSPIPGPCDRKSLDRRNDVATFTSPPLTTNLTLRGRPVLTLTSWADQPGYDLCIALSVCPASGNQVQQLSTGVRRILGDQALHPTTYAVELQALEAQLKPGDQLRLSIAGACWPAIAINPGHRDAPCGAPNHTCRVISIHAELETAELHFDPLIASLDPPDR